MRIIVRKAYHCRCPPTTRGGALTSHRGPSICWRSIPLLGEGGGELCGQWGSWGNAVVSLRPSRFQEWQHAGRLDLPCADCSTSRGLALLEYQLYTTPLQANMFRPFGQYCAEGYNRAPTAYDKCKLCPARTYTANGAMASVPSPGIPKLSTIIIIIDTSPQHDTTKARNECQACAAGEYSNIQRTECRACKAGTFPRPNKEGCAVTPVNFYRKSGAEAALTECSAGFSGVGSDHCLPCPINTYRLRRGTIKIFSPDFM